MLKKVDVIIDHVCRNPWRIPTKVGIFRANFVEEKKRNRLSKSINKPGSILIYTWFRWELFPLSDCELVSPHA